MSTNKTVLVSNNFGGKKLPIIISTQCLRQTGDLHIHRHSQLCYILSGNMTHRIGGNAYEQEPGSCSIIFPYTEHAVDFTSSEDTPVAVFISFYSDFLTDRGHSYVPVNKAFASLDNRILPFFTSLSGELREKADGLIRELLAEYEKRHEMSFDKIAEVFSEFLGLLCVDSISADETLLPEAHINAIHTAIKYIEENYAEKLSIDKVARVSAMSRAVFTKSFKAVTGMTFSHFLLALRLQNSRSLLLHTNLSLNEIARATGLNDKSHLCHMFKEHFDISPLQYRSVLLPEAAKAHDIYKKRWSWLGENV